MADSNSPPSSTGGAAAAPQPTPTGVAVLSVDTLASSTLPAVATAAAQVQDELDEINAPLKKTPFQEKAKEYNLQKRMRMRAKEASPWWMFYHEYRGGERPSTHEDGRGYACCNYCGFDVLADRTSGSSGLKRHIQLKHKSLLRFVDKKYGGTREGSKSTTLKNKLITDSMTVAGKHRKLQKTERQDLQAETAAKWLVMDVLPFTILTSKWYKQHLQSYDAGAEPPGKQKVRDKIRLLEAEIRQAQTASLEGRKIALTTDHWTSHGGDNYSGLTAHWIDDSWEMHTLVLGCFLHEGDTQSDTLRYQLFKEIFIQCGFNKANVVAIVTDTAANMNRLGMHLEELGIPHIYCVDHNLQLTAKQAYNDASYQGGGARADTMKAARALCEFFCKSTQAEANLKKAQTLLPNEYEGKIPVTVIQDVVTRWWSTFRMCDRLLYLRKAFMQMTLNSTLPEGKNLSTRQWTIVEQTHQLLKPFKESQKYLEGDKYVTISLVVRSIKNCRKMLEDTTSNPDVTDDVKNLAAHLLQDFRERWLNKHARQFNGGVLRAARNRAVGLHPLHAVGSALDPRTKNIANFNADDREHIWDYVLDLMMLLDPSASEAPNHANRLPVAVAPAAPAALPAARATHLFDDDSDDEMFDRGNTEMDGAGVNRAWQARCEAELKEYRSIQQLRFQYKDDSPNDPLKWWKANQLKFPTVAQLAKTYLAIPATSAPSERLFSMASRLITKRRNRLDPGLVGEIVYVHQNLEWYEGVLEARKREEAQP